MHLKNLKKGKEPLCQNHVSEPSTSEVYCQPIMSSCKLDTHRPSLFKIHSIDLQEEKKNELPGNWKSWELGAQGKSAINSYFHDFVVDRLVLRCTHESESWERVLAFQQQPKANCFQRQENHKGKIISKQVVTGFTALFRNVLLLNAPTKSQIKWIVHKN